MKEVWFSSLSLCDAFLLVSFISMQAFSVLEQRYLPGNPDLLDPFTRVLGIGLTQHPSESI